MQLSPTGAVLQIQGFSVNDGEGIRTTIFLAGCPLRCQWCCNPETWTVSPKMAVYPHKCIHCRTCEKVCPEGLSPPNLHREQKTSSCTACGACVKACPRDALAILINTMSVGEIIAKVERDAIFFRASGGGVTFSGGEPTFQLPFLRALTNALYDRGISLTMETCGYFNWQSAQDIFEKLDHVFLDIKHMDTHVHKKLTGVSNDCILENAQHIHATRVPLTVRIPVIPHINGTFDNLQRTASFMREKLPRASIELLPFHTLGHEKYQALGLKNPLYDNAIVPDRFVMEEGEAIFTAQKIPVQRYR